jgi:glutathione synthetase
VVVCECRSLLIYPRHGICTIRQTFEQLAESATVDSASRVLKVSLATRKTPIEVSTIYYRTGYDPKQYRSQCDYATRMRLERSRAVKCPTIPLQLVGCKKVQQVLTEPGVLESFLLDRDRWVAPIFTEEDVVAVRRNWMPMWDLSEGGEEGVEKARANAHNLVLKPQRDGGGNNIYKGSVPGFLDTLPVEERKAWIAMELISPPEGLGNYFVHAGSETPHVFKTDTSSELGIYGLVFFDQDAQNVDEKEIGWLVRTKCRDSNEGGITAGFGCLDSLLLVG